MMLRRVDWSLEKKFIWFDFEFLDWLIYIYFFVRIRVIKVYEIFFLCILDEKWFEYEFLGLKT